MNKIKKFLLICLSIVLSFVFLPQQITKAKDSLNLAEFEVVKHTAEEFIEVIRSDTNISEQDKTELINNVALLQSRRVAYDYWTIYATCQVTSEYTCRPYFYTYSSFGVGGYPHSIEEVLYANIDRNYNGVTKHFSGTLYYHLEASNKLHWDLNGDFYENSSTTIGAKISIGLGEDANMSFSVSNTSDHYAYCHKYGDVTF